MEHKKYLKKIIKNYLELRKLEKDTSLSEYMEKIEKIMLYISKINTNPETSLSVTNIDTINIDTINDLDLELENTDNINLIVYFIKNYCKKIINELFENNLYVENKLISDNIFTPVEEGNLDGISITESYNNFKVYNAEGLTPLHVCIKNGDTSILKRFLKGGESIDLNNKDGHTLLEYACELKDPNLISFLISHGSNPKKHLLFRENNKDCKMFTNDIDLANIIKICLQKGALIKSKNEINKSLDIKEKFKNICLKNISDDYLVGLGDLTFNIFYNYLEDTLFSLNEDSIKSYIDIIEEEFNYSFMNRLGCPSNKFEVLMINLVPFIEYSYNISTKFVILNELIYTIKFIFDKNNMKINKKFNEKLLNKVWKEYKEIISFDFIGTNITILLTKMKNILIKK